MVVANKCPECGATLPLRWPRALCSVCELDGALEFASAESQQIGGAGTRFGDYELLEELARGGMGVVYRARQVSLNRIVAMKFILSGQFASQQEVLRFQSEAEAAANLRHPNIVAIYEAGEQSGQQYIAMEYVAGRTLAQIVREEGPIPARRAATYIKPIAEALQYAHERGTLHRDLQPSNVLIDAEDQSRITDFGLAKRAYNSRLPALSPQLTFTGQMLGSPGFMPPEQAMGSNGQLEAQPVNEKQPAPNSPAKAAKDVSPAVDQEEVSNHKSRVGPWSDVYGIGATLYYLITGRAPFQGQTIPDTLMQLRERDPVAPRLLNPSVPQDLETICLKCLEKEPEKRYATARELAEELSRFQHDEPIRARPVSRPEKIWRWCRRKPLLAGLVASLHLVGALGLAGILWQWTRAERQRTQSEQNLYVANVHLANEALDDHNITRARKLLQGIEASPQQRAMRDWEWRYLMGQCHGDETATLGRHEAWVEGVAASFDGRWAASIDADGVVKVWDLTSRKEFDQWGAHTDRAQHRPGEFGHAIAFSSDGRILATGGADRWVRLWDPVSHHRKLADLKQLDDACTGLAFSRDGRMLAALSKHGEAVVWALSNSPPEVLLSTNTDTFVYSVAFSPDSKSLYIAGINQPIRHWDISQPPNLRELPRFESAAWPATISPDGNSVFASEPSEHILGRWDIATRKERQRWSERDPCLISPAVSPDARAVASGLSDGEIVVYSLRACLKSGFRVFQAGQA